MKHPGLCYSLDNSEHEISLSCFSFPLWYIVLHCEDMLLKICFNDPFGVIGDKF